MNKKDIDDLLLQANANGTVHTMGNKPPGERNLLSRINKLAAPLLISAAMLTAIAGCTPPSQISMSDHYRANVIEQQASFSANQEALRDLLKNEILENGANIIVTSRFINHAENAPDFLKGNEWAGGYNSRDNKYSIGYQTVNPEAPNVTMPTQYAGVSKEMFDALCNPVNTLESGQRTLEKCELETTEALIATKNFYGGESQLKADYSLASDGSIDKDSLSLRISNPGSPSEFTTLRKVSQDDGIVQEGGEIVFDQSVEDHVGSVYESAKISVRSLKDKVMSSRGGSTPSNIRPSMPRG